MYDTEMAVPHIIVDTNVLLTAMRSRLGASYKLLSLLDSGKFKISISVSLLLEYEDVLMRNAPLLGENDISDVLDYFCDVANKQTVFYLWRPVLRDPNDDLVLEVAVAGGCDAIVTFNGRDFAGAERFGVRVMTPREFLCEIGELK